MDTKAQWLSGSFFLYRLSSLLAPNRMSLEVIGFFFPALRCPGVRSAVATVHTDAGGAFEEHLRCRHCFLWLSRVVIS